MRFAVSVLVLPLLVLSAGCGYIADKDRIVVAVMDGESITRGDLDDMLRSMSDEYRPLVQNKSDLLRALNNHIDGEIMSALAKELQKSNKISIPKETIEEIYFERHPDKKYFYNLENPGQELFQRTNLSEGDLVAIQADIGNGMDEIEEILLQERALIYTVEERLRTGSITITEREFEEEIKVRGGKLVNFETVEIHAILFASREPNSLAEAGKALKRIGGGEAFEAVADEYHKKRTTTTMYAAFENDPDNEKFRSFWEYATGTERGAVMGPIFVPPFDKMEDAGGGRMETTSMEAAFIVFKVLERTPATTKTFEEAKAELEKPIARGKVVQALRDEHGVQVFEDKLPDPAGYGDQYKDSMIRTE